MREQEDNLKPSVPYIELDDGAATVSLGSSWYRLTWTNTTFNTPDFTYQSNGKILINTTGIYLIQSEVAINTSTACQIKIAIEIDGTKRDDSYSECYLASNYNNTLVVSKTLYLKKGQTVAIEYYEGNANADIVDKYSRFRLTYIPLGGWNNSSGGNIIDRGIKR